MNLDGITKYIENHEFYFDNVFGDTDTTEDLYKYSIYPAMNLILNKGIVTCFAYGQTGSGKTYTMKGIQSIAIKQLFSNTRDTGKRFEFYVSFFEIYGGRLYDLLNNRNKLSVLEDKNQKVQVFGLEEKLVESPEEMGEMIDLANSIRTTHNTVTNEVSSRSHAICNIIIKEENSEETYGKLTLVDLAGSERAQETQSNDKNRRAEGAEINKSLLALKECIRALDARKQGGEQHVPFRASKLTLVLRDAFVGKMDKSKIIMLACVSPGFSSANHTINTLRYSDRLKEKTSLMKNANKKEIDIFDMKVKSDDFLDDLEFEDSLQKLNLMPTALANSKDEWDYNYLRKSEERDDDEEIYEREQKYNEILNEDEEYIISSHMNIIKDDAKMLTEEGELISSIKGVNVETNYDMEMYIKRLEQIITKKISIYMDLKKKMEIYK